MQTETIEKLAFEGPLTAWQGVALGCVLAVAAYWSLFRVPQKARRNVSFVLFPLRLIVIALVVWMLLGPARATTMRHFTPKSLAVVRDVSGSMGVVDPPDAKADLRWINAADTESPSLLVSGCDRAATAAAVARDQVGRFVRENGRGQTPEQARHALAVSGRAAAEAVRRSQEVVRLLRESQGMLGPELASRAQDVSAALTGSGVDKIGSLVPANPSAAIVVSPDQIDRLTQWHRRLVDAARALGQLADRVANRLAETPAGSSLTARQAAVPRSRREKVEELLKREEPRWLAHDTASNSGTSRIRSYTFDQQTLAMADDKSNASTDSKANAVPKKIPVTNLSSVLERIGSDSADAGIKAALLFTDGRHNDPAAADPRAAARLLSEIPLYVVPVGSSRAVRDVILHHVDAPRTVVEGDQLVVEATISAHDCAGEKCLVELSERNAVIDRQEFTIKGIHSDSRVRLVTDGKGVGRHEYAVKVSPIKGEALPTNNASSFGVDVIDATLRVLVADDAPRWEFRYLVRLFERDKRIQYEQILFQPTSTAEGERGAIGAGGAGGAQLPRDVDGWARYRLAILGDLSPTQLDPQCQKALKEYLVDRGGTVILIAGSQAMPQAFAGMTLADFLPVAAAEASDPSLGYELALSVEGRLNPAMQIVDPPDTTEQLWQEMSRQLPVYSLSQYCLPKPAARTLINAVPSSDSGLGRNQGSTREKTFLCWQTVGRGRIVYIAAPAVYQLRMKYGDRYHYRFWGQLIRWAVARDLSQGSRTVKLSTDRARTSVGESIQVVANLADLAGRPVSNAHVAVQASTDGRASSLIELRADPKIPGRYLTEFAPAEEGSLALEAFGTDVAQLLQSEGVSKPVTTTVMVDGRPSVEMEDTRSNVPLLKQIATLTGGQVVSPAAVNEIIELTDLDPSVREETVRQPLWDRWAFLWIVCGVLSVEWTARKIGGLP